MFNFFKRKNVASKARIDQQPEAKWTVSISDGSVTVRSPEGIIQSVALSDLSGVIVQTTDGGPWAADVWWLLFGTDDRVACAYPQGATGEQPLLDNLMTLPGFDHQMMIEAMRSTENNVFPVWRRSA